MKSLLVCSNSTKDLEIVEKCDEKRIVSSAPDISILDEMGTYDNVVAIGGGAVIDTAKILSKNPFVILQQQLVRLLHLGLFIGMVLINIV